jgi:hypothetical protein
MSKNTDNCENERFDALMAEAARTRALDRLDVREGRINSQALSWFSREYVQSVQLTFPDAGNLEANNKDSGDALYLAQKPDSAGDDTP